MAAAEIRSLPARVPAHDERAEQAVISACMLDHDKLDLIAWTILRPDDFYTDRNKRIFEALVDLRKGSSSYDLVTIAQWLHARDRLDQVGGSAYLAEVVDYTPAIGNVEEHARIIALLARRRRLVAECQRVAAEGYGAIDDTEMWLESSSQALLSAASGGQFIETQSTLRELVEAEMEAFGRHDGPPPGAVDLSFGDPFAALYPHAEPGDLVVIAGRPGHGKTALALEGALHIAQQGTAAVFFTLEMQRRSIAQRAIAQDASVPFHGIRTGKFDSQDSYYRMGQAAERLGKLPIVVDDRSAPTIAQLEAGTRRAAARLGGRRIGAVFIDYIQLVDGQQQRNEPRENAVARVSKGLKRLAKELVVVVFGLSQLNRDIERERRRSQTRRPNLGDLRESGQIEQDADAIMFVHQDDKYRDADDRDGVSELILAKQRNGATGTVRLRFAEESMRFDPVAGEVWP